MPDALRPDALPPVRHWRIHLGAHKTATTHLQDTLVALRPALAEAGVDAIPNAAFRPLWPALLPRRRDWRRWWPGTGPAAAIDAALTPLRLGPDTLLLSEENLPGEVSAAVGPRPYPGLGSRLRVLAGLGRDAELSVFFSIRRMDRFLASAYAEALRFFTFETGFDVMGPRLAAEPPRWSEVVGRIRRAMPRARLTVWCYEDYARHTPEILTRLAGADPGPLPDIPRPPQTQTPSAAAVHAAEQVETGLGYDAHVAAVARIYADAPAAADAPAFRPFSDEAVARFAAAYAADCDALARDGVLLRF